MKRSPKARDIRWAGTGHHARVPVYYSLTRLLAASWYPCAVDIRCRHQDAHYSIEA